ncbi:membrane protein [Candidatus Magnetobacterium bavaricum]|uniref:Membrane protein n=1 Tax=Candidatus Magnetobacterium bavaricum TaxID=29290 RepID=A0A0F3GZD3_9BACT|nr:membrane protein [Candidatus Magnetobacterium bavaricum]
MKWLDRSGILLVIFICLFILNALSGIALSEFIAFGNTGGPLPLGERIFLLVIVFIFVASTFAFWRLRKNLRKIRAAIITTIVIAAPFYWMAYTLGILPFVTYLFQIPYFIATGWIYYVLHIAENVRSNVTEIVLGVVILALLLVGLHTFVRWFSAVRNEPPTTRPLRWSVAVFILMFATGISTTASIHQLIWIAKAPKRLERRGGGIKAVESGAKGAVSDLQGYLDSYAADEPYIIVTDSTGKQGCIEATNAANTGRPARRYTISPPLLPTRPSPAAWTRYSVTS